MVGWASQNGGVTGGGTVAAATIVTNYNDLKTAITSTAVKVINISGTITIPSGGRLSLKDQSGKTIFGLPGSKLVSSDQSADNSGILYIRNCSNIIFKNVTFEGPGAYDADGWDNMTLDNCTNVWIDHCEFQDGMDGNFDIKNSSDYITVTWCKFIYNKAPRAGGPGGADDHRFSDLFGSSDGTTTDRGKLRVTMQYCWWAQGCKARMPRVRFGKVHIANNLFNSTVAAQCIQAGFEADLLVESNVFENVNRPIDLMDNNFTAVTEKNNKFLSTTGNKAGSGTAFTPPYTLDVTLVDNVKDTVITNAGATLTSASCDVTTPVTYTLSTTATPTVGGTITGAGTYTSGTVVTVKATPATGYTFTGWSGDASGTDATITVTMSGNKSVTANFQADAATPTNYILSTTVTPNAGGTISGAGTYTSGTVVTVKATPATGYTFTGWSGDASGTNASITVTMSGNKSVTANFQADAATPTNYTLSTTATPAAGGTITGAGAYTSGTVVTVKATPATGYTFTGWSGDASGTNASITVTMSGNKSVTANFQADAATPTNYTLSTTATPAAGGTITGAGTYTSGTVVTVKATPATGYTFTGWSGDASGTATSVTVTMSGNKSVTANFQADAVTPTNYTLSTTATPTAGGTITGAGTYTSGTAVTVKATPATGYTFTGWSGDASGTDASVTVTMSGNKSVTANFQEQVIAPVTYTLSTTSIPTGGGTILGAGTYDEGTVVTVTVTPSIGYTFTGWSGDISDTSPSVTITMNSNKSIIANFDAQSSVSTIVTPQKLFSPDNRGDATTETWLIENAYLLDGCEIIVYNRQGQKVYSSVGYPSPWNGTLDGRPLPDGAYFYIIRYPNQKKQTGSVTIARLK
ncbi:Listeria/Bacterioides repeat-containing protein/gliding motility-associated C-terminal domain-containing protein [Ohtaekwangia koreensis]|uniref:Listeria/Bacterioides repeat-containing protein/gliding motility-associated C-terminal domain-containing protein n=1 Tax=Ohtaekwangia koreensis TaxID=688867 RepID=A0A1T5M6T7_9BACT|nr:Listeria/Bacterioides repeat-containing protein/gliding motility-associated C-terminal domain-containing protein [Ohtaekwangia koreensis]